MDCAKLARLRACPCVEIKPSLQHVLSMLQTFAMSKFDTFYSHDKAHLRQALDVQACIVAW